MKKLNRLFVCLFTIQSGLRANDDKPIKVYQLPQPAQQFVKSHFGDSKVAMANMETDSLDNSYDVIFPDGNKVEFDNQVNWKEVN